MSDFNASPILGINGQVATPQEQRALALKVYGQEVLMAMARASETKGRYMEKTISSGKSHQFPAFGRKKAGYHNRGEQLTGTDLNANERIITIDGKLKADSFIDEFEEAMAHYDVRSPHVQADGEALAIEMDIHMYATLIQEARNATPNVQGTGGAPDTGTGTQIISPNALTDASAIEALFFEAGEKFDNNYVMSSDRMAHLTPGQYNLLINSAPRAIDKDYSGEGSVASGKIVRLNDFEIIKSRNFFNEIVGKNITATDPLGKYGGDFSNSAALFTHKSAVGTTFLRGLQVKEEYQTANLGHLIVSYIQAGHGGLRPESAIEVVTA